jgi:hypothetical protein
VFNAPFKFSISERPEGVEVVLKLYNWQSFGRSCLLVLIPISILTFLFSRSDATPSKVFVVILFLLAALGCFGLALSIVKRVLRFSDHRLTLRTFRLGVPTGLRTFSLEKVEQFGFGLFGHSLSPVLKFQVGNTWIVLASGVSEDEVIIFLRELCSYGVNLQHTV